jgi:hypothetical protein
MKPALVRIAAAGLLVVPLLVASQPASASLAAAPDALAAGVRRQLAAGVQVAPKQAAGAKLATAGANPYLALVPDPTTVDYSSWKSVAQSQSSARAAAMAANLNLVATPPLIHDEAEPAGVFGANDTPATAELVKGLGTGRNENGRSRVLGQFSPQAVTVSTLSPFPEDDGSIPLAGNPNVAGIRPGAQVSATIGDGPHGSTGDDSGDFDFQKITATAGQEIVADADTPTGPLDTVIGLYDAAGTLIATNDDSGGTLDSLLRFTVTVSGTYYVLLSGFGFGTVFPADPFDSGSGLGSGSEGPYDLTITVAAPDRDVYAVDLDGGDVLGASVTGAGINLTVRDPDGTVMMRSEQDASFIYSPNAPLPGGGNAVADAVAPKTGRYTLEIGGSTGTYDVTLEVYRPGPEALPQGTTQTVFLDFDGARANTAIWGGPGVRELSPLAGFIGRWGLTAAQEDAVINATIATVKENVVTDLRNGAVNQRLGLRILNSRDDADPPPQPNVHRVIVGGTIAESGINTIGIAQFIDPGNYSTDDSALVLLDVLSNPSGAASLNTYITPASKKIQFIGRALGNVISHEMGHLLGNFHTDSFDGTPSLMDAGGNFPGLFGVGPDNIGGTDDDVDYDFTTDTLDPNEGFEGDEDTLNVAGWALVKGRASN